MRKFLILFVLLFSSVSVFAQIINNNKNYTFAKSNGAAGGTFWYGQVYLEVYSFEDFNLLKKLGRVIKVVNYSVSDFTGYNKNKTIITPIFRADELLKDARPSNNPQYIELADFLLSQGWPSNDTITKSTLDIVTIVVTVNDDKVRIRDEPNTDSNIVLQVDKYTYLKLYKSTKEFSKIGNEEYPWYYIQTGDGRFGWIFGKYIDFPEIEIDSEW